MSAPTLTDEDRAQIKAAWDDEHSLRKDAAQSAYERGKAAGIAAERERCARICETLIIEYVGNSALTLDQCAEAIRNQGKKP